MSSKYSERTFIMVKPDGVQRGLVGEIIKRFETRGYKLVGLKMARPSRSHVEKHYEDLSQRSFFKDLVEYMLSGPVTCMIWEGNSAVRVGRDILGETNPLDSKPGTIRGDFCQATGRNVVHGSDAVESADREIQHWFTRSEIFEYEQAGKAWIHE